MHLRATSVTGAIVVLLAACSISDAQSTTSTAAAAPIGAPDHVVTRDVSYTTTGELLDVHAPDGSEPSPVVVIIPGANSPRSNSLSLVNALVAEGAVVFNVGVSIPGPTARATEHIACAMRFARARAADYGGDPAKITMVAQSAGAALGIVVALAGNDDTEDCEATDGSALPDAFVGYEGAYDWTTGFYSDKLYVPLNPYGWDTIDPYAQIGEHPDLVIRLIHGEDTNIQSWELDPRVSVEFNQALLDAGYDTDLILLQGMEHTALERPGSEAIEVVVEQALH